MNLIPSTPTLVDQSNLNDLLCQIQNHESNNDLNGRRRNYVHLTSKQFSVLITCFQRKQQDISNFLTQSPAPPGPPSSDQFLASVSKTKTSDCYNIFKLDDTICHPILPANDGSTDNFAPFLNHLDLHRQDEAWAPTTYRTHDGRSFELLKQWCHRDNHCQYCIGKMDLCYSNGQ